MDFNNPPVLKDAYESFFAVGNVVSPRDLGTERFDLLTKHFSILTAENAMKPIFLQEKKGVFTFDEADKMVNAVLDAGLKMHGHTLTWHQQSPEWLYREGIDRNEAIDNLVTHARTVAAHYRGKMVSWDVLNEAINDSIGNPQDWKSCLRRSPWYNAIGPDYIEIVFLAAREADPGALLYYNEYNMDNQRKALAVYNMVKELNEKYPNAGGRPLIDGVGMQGHYRVNTNPEQVKESLERFISLGVVVSITELDVGAGADLTDEKALEQGIAYARLFALFKKYPLGRVTIWGLDDGRSWRRQNYPTLFDAQLKAKPAFFGVLDPDNFLTHYKDHAVEKNLLRSKAPYGAPALDPSHPRWKKAPELPVNKQITAWQGAAGTAKALWDENNLYVMVKVENAVLNKNHPSPWEQDSVEIFIDEGNHKTNYMQEDDGQYRINFDNERSFNPPSIEAGFESKTYVSGQTYTVVAKIPFKTLKPKKNMEIGFDIQINGASAQGMRQNIAVWNDLTGNAWQDPSCYGILKLIK